MATAVKGPYGIQKQPSWARRGDWTRGISEFDVNGTLSVMHLVNKAKKEECNEDIFHWLEEEVSAGACDLPTGKIFTNPGLSSAYTSGGTAGQTLYILLDDAAGDDANVGFANEIVPGDEIVITSSDNRKLDTLAEVKSIESAGGSAWKVAVKLREADDNGAGDSIDLSDADRLIISSSAYSTGITGPEGVIYQADEYENRLQIVRTGVTMDGDVIDEDTRETDGKSKWAIEKAKALVRHGGKLEGAIWNGVESSGTEGGKRKTTTRGIFNFLREQFPENWVDFRTATGAYLNKTWEEVGHKWLLEQLERYSYYAPNDPTAICGTGAQFGLDALARANSMLTLEPGAKVFNTAATKMKYVAGELDLITSRAFNREPSTRNRIVLIAASNIKYRYKTKRDTRFNHDPNSRSKGGTLDGEKGDWQTHFGLQLRRVKQILVLDGVGLNNGTPT